MRKLHCYSLKELIFFFQSSTLINWNEVFSGVPSSQRVHSHLPGLGSGTVSAFCVIAVLYPVYENVVYFYLPRVAFRNAAFML